MPHSFSKNPSQTGSYLRVVQDIARVIDELRLQEASPAVQFILYYAMCEKLAAAMDGVACNKPVSSIYTPRYKVDVKRTEAACEKLGFKFNKSDIVALFEIDPKVSARSIRNDFLHQPGPSHLKRLNAATSSMIPKMQRFLDGSKATEDYILSLP